MPGQYRGKQGGRAFPTAEPSFLGGAKYVSM
jgi:hypothetical protein